MNDHTTGGPVDDPRSFAYDEATRAELAGLIADDDRQAGRESQPWVRELAAKADQPPTESVSPPRRYRYDEPTREVLARIIVNADRDAGRTTPDRIRRLAYTDGWHPARPHPEKRRRSWWR